MSPVCSLYRQSGFSLLELAIVVFILGILISGLLVPLAVRQEQTGRNDTELILEQARDALLGFALRNGRLPCPDCADDSGGCSAVSADSINDGKEDRDSSNACREPYGYLPWADLGVGQHDSWGYPLTYQVTEIFADDIDGTGCETGLTTPDVSFSLCSEGDITVYDDLPATGTDIAQYIPAIIVSHGRNFSLNDPSGYETENLDDDTDFIQREYSKKENAEFDDILIWISPHTLRLKMVEAGLLP